MILWMFRFKDPSMLALEMTPPYESKELSAGEKIK